MDALQDLKVLQVGQLIARPFAGKPGFERRAGRICSVADIAAGPESGAPIC
jgi:hypothetical protein